MVGCMVGWIIRIGLDLVVTGITGGGGARRWTIAAKIVLNSLAKEAMDQ